jgi:Rap1a immunity proteins
MPAYCRDKSMGDFVKTTSAVFVALALAAIPAEAAVPAPVMKVMGVQFNERCSNPLPGREAEVIAVCEAYVAGIADGLQAQGKICVGPRMTAERLFPFALNWIRSHAAYQGRPPGLQISNGLVDIFPCRATVAPSRAQKMSLKEMFDTGASFIAFMKVAAPWLASVGL